MSVCIYSENIELATFLIERNAKIFIDTLKYRDKSPFFVAINLDKLWAIELFCDHGCDISIPTARGLSPLMYAASEKHDDICMYLSLRVKQIDQVNEQNGKQVFIIYLLREDKKRMKQLLMRGADVNYVNQKTGWTPLHFAIQNKLSSKTIKFLINEGAYIHQMDFNGKDCCDKASMNKRYDKIKFFKENSCKENPYLRRYPENMNEMKQQLKKREIVILPGGSIAGSSFQAHNQPSISDASSTIGDPSKMLSSISQSSKGNHLSVG